MIKTYYECDICKAHSFENGLLTNIEIKLQRYIGFRAEVRTTNISLCGGCLLNRCNLAFPNKGEALHPFQTAVQEQGVAERLVSALSDFVQENLQP